MRVVEAYERGEGSFATVAAEFGVGEASLKRWVWQYRREGHIIPQPKRGGKRSDICLTELETIVHELGDATVDEITKRYNHGRRGGARRHPSSIKRALHRAGFVVKKNGSARWSSSDPT